MEKDLEMARRMAGTAAERGGRVYFVGGFVRDGVMGRESKDVDIEIHGMTADAVRGMLGEIGPWKEMGASFGVFGLRGYTLDIALPRRGGGKGEDADIDPFMGRKEAERRRDFTMNAMMQDVLTGKVVDHFGGVADLHKGVLRHVNSKTFVEDPLRVLRAAQFAARFDFTLAPETVNLARTMDLSTLASERIFGELEKALLKAERPSVFFREMSRMEQMTLWFPEVEQLKGIGQNPLYHPEGDVYIHSMQVLDRAALYREQAKDPVGFMLSALVHDFGKITATRTTEKGIQAIGHETEGLPLVETFIRRLTNEAGLRKYVLNMTRLHMRPNRLAADHARLQATNRMFDESVDPVGLLLLARCDRSLRQRTEEICEEEAFLEERLVLFEEIMARPCVMGADLVKAGLKPGPAFSDVLSFAHTLRLSGVEKEKALPQVLSYAREKGL